MHVELKQNLDARGMRIGLAASGYHRAVTDLLRKAAAAQFSAAGGRTGDLLVVETPGSFELTAVCRALAYRGDMDAVVALGCIITGQTTHDQYLAQAVAQGLTSITVQTGVPIAFGVLTCQSMVQARERAGGSHGNKGAEAMAAAIAAALAVRAVEGATSGSHRGSQQASPARRPRGAGNGRVAALVETRNGVRGRRKARSG
jgi:6,7-dimethyl-8-ribityllumazine synthase